MTWVRVEREEVRLGDRIRIVVPEVLAVAEGADGRPAFGYDQTSVFIERWDDDAPAADEVGAALAAAGVTDLRRGIPLDDLRVEAGAGDVFVSGRIPAGLLDGVNLSALSLVRDDEIDEAEYGPDGQLNWRRTLHPRVPKATPRDRCPDVDPDEGQCLYVPHGDDVAHWHSMSNAGPFDAPKPEAAS